MLEIMEYRKVVQCFVAGWEQCEGLTVLSLAVQLAAEIFRCTPILVSLTNYGAINLNYI